MSIKSTTERSAASCHRSITSNSSEDLGTVKEFLHQMQVYGLCKNFRFEVDGGEETLGEKVKLELEAIFGPKEKAN